MAAAKRKSAFFSATQEAQKQVEQENTVKPSSSDIVLPIDSETVSQPKGDTLLPPSSVSGLPFNSDTVASSQSETVTLQQSKEVKPLYSTTTKKESKTSIYFTPEEVNKLDDLAYEYKKRTGKRINRNDIVRYLVDHCSIEDLHDIE